MDDTVREDGVDSKFVPYSGSPAAEGSAALEANRARIALVNTLREADRPLHAQQVVAPDGKKLVPTAQDEAADRRFAAFMQQQHAEPQPALSNMQKEIAGAPETLLRYVGEAQQKGLRAERLLKLKQAVEAGRAVSPTMVENAAIVDGLKPETVVSQARPVVFPETVATPAVTTPAPALHEAPEKPPVVVPKQSLWSRLLGGFGFGPREPEPVT